MNWWIIILKLETNEFGSYPKMSEHVVQGKSIVDAVLSAQSEIKDDWGWDSKDPEYIFDCGNNKPIKHFVREFFWPNTDWKRVDYENRIYRENNE